MPFLISYSKSSPSQETFLGFPFLVPNFENTVKVVPFKFQEEEKNETGSALKIIISDQAQKGHQISKDLVFSNTTLMNTAE